MAPPKPAPSASPANLRGKVLSGPSSQPSSLAPKTSSQTRGKFLGQKPTVTSTPTSSSVHAKASSQTAQTRGKFVGSSPSSHTRGKFLGKKPESSQSSMQASASSGSLGDAEEDSLDNLRISVHNSKVASVTRRKAIERQRQSVLDDLDEAENIVLSLLECAAGTANSLSEMTTAKSRKRNGEKKDDDAGTPDQSFEELTAYVRSNGVGYLTGVKKLHKLLAPHASLVKSYKNHGAETPSETSDVTNASVAATLSGGAAKNKFVEDATSNMYAVRVKKRLAMERSELMKEMIRLEELEGVGDGTGGDGMNDEDTTGSKRKHESIEQQS